MDREDAEQMAKAAGALEPQTAAESAAAGIMAHNGQSWADSPKARARLAEWTELAMNGVLLPPKTQSTGCALIILIGIASTIWSILGLHACIW